MELFTLAEGGSCCKGTCPGAEGEAVAVLGWLSVLGVASEEPKVTEQLPSAEMSPDQQWWQLCAAQGLLQEEVVGVWEQGLCQSFLGKAAQCSWGIVCVLFCNIHCCSIPPAALRCPAWGQGPRSHPGILGDLAVLAPELGCLTWAVLKAGLCNPPCPAASRTRCPEQGEWHCQQALTVTVTHSI